MYIFYDEEKNESNIAKHGVTFEHADMFDWDGCITVEDTRYDYEEQRFISYGYLQERLHVLVWTPRGNDIRIISFRKAKPKEKQRYG